MTEPVLPLLSALAVSLAADQAVKAALLARVAQTPVPSWAGLTLRARVAGRTFASRLGVRAAGLVLVWLFCLLASLLLAPHVGVFDGPLAQAALGLALGGAAANLADLLVRGGVVDYIEVGQWPAFNLADVAIASGVIVALIAR